MDRASTVSELRVPRSPKDAGTVVRMYYRLDGKPAAAPGNSPDPADAFPTAATSLTSARELRFAV